VISDDHAGLGAARTAVFPAVPWQRCQFHLQQNAQAYVPRLDQRAAVAQAIRTVFDCPDRLTAQARLKEIVAAHAATAPKLAAWMEENLPQGLAIFAFPAPHQRRLRTSNPLERVNMELKRRTRGPACSPMKLPCSVWSGALLAEISEEWETGKTYLNMESKNPALSLMLHNFTKKKVARPAIPGVCSLDGLVACETR